MITVDQTFPNQLLMTLIVILTLVLGLRLTVDDGSKTLPLKTASII